MDKVSTRFIFVCALIVLLIAVNIAYFCVQASLPESLLAADINLAIMAAGFYFGSRRSNVPD